MTDALTNAERLLREKCDRARLMGQRCNPEPPFVLCEYCAAADALAAERERRGEPQRWYPQGFAAQLRKAIENAGKQPVILDRLTVESIADCLDDLAPLPPSTGVCECGDPSATSCVSCIVADYQAQHPSCTTCCPLPARPTPEPSEATPLVVTARDREWICNILAGAHEGICASLFGSGLPCDCAGGRFRAALAAQEGDR